MVHVIGWMYQVTQLTASGAHLSLAIMCELMVISHHKTVLSGKKYIVMNRSVQLPFLFPKVSDLIIFMSGGFNQVIISNLVVRQEID
jgi:hypothetical protein